MPDSLSGMRIIEIREWVRRHLGASAIEIELTDGDIDTAIGDACRVLNRYVPGIGTDVLGSLGAGTGGGNEVILGSSFARNTRFFVDHKGLIDVIDVNFVRKLQFTDFIGIENPFYLDAVMRTFQGGSAAEYFGDLTYMEIAKKNFSSYPEWRTEWVYDPEEKRMRLSLYIDVSSLGVSFEFYDIGYVYTFRYEASDDPQNGIGTIPVSYEDWFRRYTVASAKQILGRILRKYDGIPSPFGGKIATDGASLLEEGKEEAKELEQDARDFRRTIPFLTE